MVNTNRSIPYRKKTYCTFWGFRIRQKQNFLPRFPYIIIIQMSYVGSTSSTVDRDIFSTMFKVNQIFDDLNPLRIKMMQYFGWTRVGTLFYGDDINVSVSAMREHVYVIYGNFSQL